MTDQAERLRELVRQLKQGKQQGCDDERFQDRREGDPESGQADFAHSGLEAEPKPTAGARQEETRVIAITSGKGGVGKTNFALNFALALQKLGRQVVIWDADFGFANLHVLMGKTPKVTLLSLLQGEGDIWQAISPGIEGLQYISGGHGMKEMFRLSGAKLERFMAQFMQLRGYADYLLIDLGAGLSTHSLNLLLAADEIILIATPEPTALTDAYAVLKMLSLEDKALRVHLLINRAKNEREGTLAYKKMEAVAERFLALTLHRLGILPDDPHVIKAVHQQIPYLLAYPNSPISRRTMALAEHFIQFNPFVDDLGQPADAARSRPSFWSRFRQLFHSAPSIPQGKR